MTPTVTLKSYKACRGTDSRPPRRGPHESDRIPPGYGRDAGRHAPRSRGVSSRVHRGSVLYGHCQSANNYAVGKATGASGAYAATVPMKKTSIVFTGTRTGMTVRQAAMVTELLLDATRLYHGCCHGADVEAHRIARELHGADFWIEGFPSTTEQEKCGLDLDMRHSLDAPLHRNQMMVRRIARFHRPLVLAAPRTMVEERRSGTWATIRYAKKQGVPVIVCRPDGSMEVCAS